GIERKLRSGIERDQHRLAHVRGETIKSEREADQDAGRDRDAKRDREGLRGFDEVRVEPRRRQKLSRIRNRIERRGQRARAGEPEQRLPRREHAGDQNHGAQSPRHLRRLASIFFSQRKNIVLTVAAIASTSTISGYITALSKLL